MQAIQPDQLEVIELEPRRRYEVNNLTRQTSYEVTFNRSGIANCSCPSRKLCKHIIAVRKRLEEAMTAQQPQPQPPGNVTPLQPKLDPTQELLIITKALAASNPPNWQRPLKAYSKFDWSKIGSIVLEQDQHGATKVSWCGHVYLRRAGENKKFGVAIWFSRGNGRGEDGEANYVRLITFRNSEVKAEPLPDYVARALR